MSTIKFMRKLTPAGGSIKVTLPAAICDTLELKHGQYVQIYIEEGRIIIVPHEKENSSAREGCV